MQLKNYKKIYCYTIVIFAFSMQINAQKYHHSSFWSRLAVEKSIKKWNLKAEIDFRQQNDFEKPLNNPFAKPEMRWARFYANYSKGKFSHTLILPNLIKSYPLLGKTEDVLRLPTIEWRCTLFEEVALPFKKLTTSIRADYEFRILTTNNVTRNTARVRFRLNETLKISQTSNIVASFEPIYNIGPNKALNTFSQSQLVFRFSHRFGNHLNFTTGINHLFRKRNTLIEYDLQNAILCNFNFTI